MLKHDDELRRGLSQMIEDLAGLSQVAGLGFWAPDAEILSRSLERVRGEGRWAYADLRGMTDAQVEARLASLSARPIVVLVTAATEIPVALAKRLRAALARSRGEHRQSLFLLVDGVASLEGVTDRDLLQVSYWSFLP